MKRYEATQLFNLFDNKLSKMRGNMFSDWVLENWKRLHKIAKETSKEIENHDISKLDGVEEFNKKEQELAKKYPNDEQMFLSERKKIEEEFPEIIKVIKEHNNWYEQYMQEEIKITLQTIKNRFMSEDITAETKRYILWLIER